LIKQYEVKEEVPVKESVFGMYLRMHKKKYERKISDLEYEITLLEAAKKNEQQESEYYRSIIKKLYNKFPKTTVKSIRGDSYQAEELRDYLINET
jgi:hypothetical protein